MRAFLVAAALVGGVSFGLGAVLLADILFPIIHTDGFLTVGFSD